MELTCFTICMRDFYISQGGNIIDPVNLTKYAAEDVEFVREVAYFTFYCFVSASIILPIIYEVCSK